MTHEDIHANQGRFSNSPCEYYHQADVIVSRGYNSKTGAYEVIARDSKTKELHKCIGREIDKQYNKKDIPLLSLGNERII